MVVAFFAPSYVQQQSPGHFEKLFSYPMLSLRGKTRAAKGAYQSILCNLNYDGTINHMDPFAYLLQQKSKMFSLSVKLRQNMTGVNKETSDHTEQKHWVLCARSTLK